MSTNTPESVIPEGDDASDRDDRDYSQARDRTVREERTGVEGDSDDTSMPAFYIEADDAESSDGDDAPYGDVRNKQAQSSDKGKGKGKQRQQQ